MAKREQRRRKSLKEKNLKMKIEIDILKTVKRVQGRSAVNLKRCRTNNRKIRKDNFGLKAAFSSCVQENDAEIERKDNLIKNLIGQLEKISLNAVRCRRRLSFDDDEVLTTTAKRHLDIDEDFEDCPNVKRPRLQLVWAPELRFSILSFLVKTEVIEELNQSASLIFITFDKTEQMEFKMFL